MDIKRINDRLKYIGRAMPVWQWGLGTYLSGRKIELPPEGDPRFSDWLAHLQKIENEEELHRSIHHGPSSTLAIWESIPSERDIAIELCSLLNTSGGSIIFGASATGKIIGIDRSSLKRKLDSAKSLLDTEFYCTLYFIANVRGLVVGIATVPFLNGNIVALVENGVAFERRDSTIVPLTASTINANMRALIQSEAQSHEEIVSAVEAYSALVASKFADLNTRISSADSWKRKSYEMLAAGAVGAVLSLILSLLVSSSV
jgi:hypothetical protein